MLPDVDTKTSQTKLRRLLRRYGWLRRVRPQILAEPLYKLVSPYEHRKIIDVNGVRLYADAFSDVGATLVQTGEYEEHLWTLIQKTLRPGSNFFDIGAQEGIFSALAAKIVGCNGLVVAVEPQSRLRDILEINIALNSSGRHKIYPNAIGLSDGERVSISLGPISNTGGSGIVRKYRWSSQRDIVTTRTVDSLVKELHVPAIDLMKVDVEGFEPEVIKSAETALHERVIAVLAIDYHIELLKERGINVDHLHQFVCQAGYQSIIEKPEGHVVYTRAK